MPALCAWMGLGSSISMKRCRGLPLDAIKVEVGDSNYPFSGGSGGSTTSASVAPAIRVTAGKALDALKARVAPNARRRACDARRVRWEDSGQGQPVEEPRLEGRVPPARDRAGLSGRRVGSGPVGQRHERRAVRRGRGGHRDRRHASPQDRLRAGLRARSSTSSPPRASVIGGIVMGVNYALFENRLLDRNTGQMVNPNMEWYLLAGPPTSRRST